MNTLKCIIADDEPIARQILENYIADTPNLELVRICKNAFEVIELLQEQQADILFLDINMPKLSGLALLKTLKQRPNVVITTAYTEYAVEGFDLAVTDYLLKPFSLERFLRAVLKVREQISQKGIVQYSNHDNEETSIFVKSDKKIIKIEFNMISYIEAYGNYIKIYTNHMILTPQTLSDFLKKLPNHFLRIHKSYIINFNHVELIEGNQIILQDDIKLPIGKSYKKAVLNRI
ncbi:LytTR family DNA-binding domain-containing protein [Winogradskyella sp.]|uniref:LytR/AlgR family response regulator transcription factor n=1 Tax=Winogradskyella sp. TaxID=1883156 RepID=UPI00261083C8|nr:LytTR family DNA-binding domain-containing protein [Winogradskyella sp.]